MNLHKENFVCWALRTLNKQTYVHTYIQAERSSLEQGIRLRELPSRERNGRVTSFCSLRQRDVSASRQGLSEIQSTGSTELEGIPQNANTLAQQNRPSYSLLAGTTRVWAACSFVLPPDLILLCLLQTLAGFLATLSRPQAGVLLGRHKDWKQHQQQVPSTCRFLSNYSYHKQRICSCFAACSSRHQTRPDKCH